MARIRSVHPGLFTDEAWVSCSPLARLLIIGLWTDADDQGVFEWKPLQIKMRLLPGDMAEAAPLLAELERAGMVRRYEVASRAFGAIRNFRRFQRPKKPNALHPITDAIRIFVALDAAGPEPEDDDTAPVPNQFPTASEIPSQMEDVGGRRKEEGEANASLVAEGDFDAAWRGYPHVKGRSSKPKSGQQWNRINASRRPDVLLAIGRYAREGREPKEDCGAPAFDKWLRDQRYLDWLEAPQSAAPAWAGPAEIREAVVAAKGEEFARSYLDPCTWQDVPMRALIPRTVHGSRALERELRGVLAVYDVTVLPTAERAA